MKISPQDPKAITQVKLKMKYRIILRSLASSRMICWLRLRCFSHSLLCRLVLMKVRMRHLEINYSWRGIKKNPLDKCTSNSKRLISTRRGPILIKSDRKISSLIKSFRKWRKTSSSLKSFLISLITRFWRLMRPKTASSQKLQIHRSWCPAAATLEKDVSTASATWATKSKTSPTKSVSTQKQPTRYKTKCTKEFKGWKWIRRIKDLKMKIKNKYEQFSWNF